MDKTMILKYQFTSEKVKQRYHEAGHFNPLSYGSDKAGAFDFRALLGESEVTIDPGCDHIFSTGIMIQIPTDHMGLAATRSGNGIKRRVVLNNAVGYIDSDYRGEIFVGLTNNGTEAFTVQPFDRIAQMTIVPVIRMEFEESALTDTARGSGGLGSTGAK